MRPIQRGSYSAGYHLAIFFGEKNSDESDLCLSSFFIIINLDYLYYVMDDVGTKVPVSMTTGSIHNVLLDKVRAYVLERPEIVLVLGGLTRDRYAGKTHILQEVDRQLVGCLRTFDKASAADMDTATHAFTFVLGDEGVSVEIDASLAVVCEWVASSFHTLAHEAWWNRCHERLEKCRRIVLCGGVFSHCPSLAMKVWAAMVGPAAKACSVVRPTFIMEGASLHTHSMRGQREMLARPPNRQALPHFLERHHAGLHAVQAFRHVGGHLLKDG